MESLVLAMVSKPSVSANARDLLGSHLVGHGVTIRVTEVEAYGGSDDPASHAFRRTPRSAIMFGPTGRLYVYRIHGHHCANVVTGPTDQGAAVLIRAGEVIEGIDVARERRSSRRTDGREIPTSALARGPGNLCRAAGITMADLDTDLANPTSVHLSVGDAPTAVSVGPRVGVRHAADVPWRFWVTDDPTVSAYRRHAHAAAD
ncbi:DNA-3-methyladenine glycosylase [Gordonia soli]|uniref:Putative 3-methyladenine DNA glycosylase n=1 Tax=Gordonia soli NBRC 108243 TaxID=1223545 RepID=M0QI84_9ACTN|nr:DNA-3-methyladenine glycosylase [Gordonia soli]GAC68258.1 putative 3-methyladenine DNA glycosylase [Gordonia soli NBRC 108243]